MTKKTPMSRKPVAILISDVHYTVKTLELADTAFRMAIDKASELKAPLFDCGDLTDGKSILPAQVVNALLETRSYAVDKLVPIWSIVGNHSLLNERSTSENALNFLDNETWGVIKSPISFHSGFNFIPYQPTPELFVEALNQFPKGSLIIAHQGLTKAWPGEYCHDHSAINPAEVAEYRVLSGHYHRAQDIKTGRPRKGAVGLWSYVGTPYTTSFAEAGDGPKGFQILYDDGLMELVPTNLRKHVVIECTVSQLVANYPIHPELPRLNDLVWLKLYGSNLELERFDKQSLGEQLGLPENYRLDKIPDDAATPPVLNIEKKSGFEILNELIDNEDEAISLEERDELKQLAEEIMK